MDLPALTDPDLQVERPGGRLAAWRAGQGPTVVLLHAGVADSRMWAELRQTLVASFTTLAYDRPGFGASPPASDPIDPVADLCAVVDAAVPAGPVVLVGCSQGGRIALDAALGAPGRWRALVLIAPAVSGAPELAHPDPVLRALEEEWEQAAAAGDLERVNAVEAHVWLDGPHAPRGRVGGAARALFLEMNRIALAAPPAELIAPEDTWDRLEAIDLPTLVLCGSRDEPDTVQRCAELARRLPRARHEAIPGCAHLPSLEQPEPTARRIAAFLASLEA